MKKTNCKKENFTKLQMLPKCKCHQNGNVAKTQMWTNLKCHQNSNFASTQVLSTP
jgi:hypothetical protein